MFRFALCWSILFLAISCRSDAPPADCPTHKMSFNQSTSCLNDGFVEFCLPADDPGALAAVHNITPEIRCRTGRGRARCDLQTDLLCMFPTSGEQCDRRHGSLHPEPWQELCTIAAMETVQTIVPTWYE